MPKRRPMKALKELGQQIRSRRLHVGRTREVVARAAEISVTQLVTYETGQGHPPAFTLHRLAVALGTSTSSLLGETPTDDVAQVREMIRVQAHPVVGAVVRYMQKMPKEDCQSLRIIAAAFAARRKDCEVEGARARSDQAGDLG